MRIVPFPVRFEPGPVVVCLQFAQELEQPWTEVCPTHAYPPHPLSLALQGEQPFSLSRRGWRSVCQATAALGIQLVPDRSIAFKMTKSFRMHATKATFAGFPAATNRRYNRLTTGFQRRAATAAMYSARRTLARPPQIPR